MVYNNISEPFFLKFRRELPSEMKEIGIDLGSAYILVSSSDKDMVVREPSLMAVDRASGRILKVGSEAQQYLNNPDDATMLVVPFRDGIVSNCDATQRMLSHCIKLFGRGLTGSKVILGVPCGMSRVEEGALAEIAVHAGARKCYLVYSAVAALIGCGYTGRGTRLIVDIGSRKTDIVLVSEGSVIYKYSLNLAGDAFDRAISSYIAENHDVRVGPKTSENIKLKIGTVWLETERKYLDVKGRRVSDRSATKTVRIYSDEMFEALEEPTAAIIEAICVAVSKIPSECVGEVLRSGIVLTGGGSMLDGLARLISGVTGIETTLAKNPKSAAITGLVRILGQMQWTPVASDVNISEKCLIALRNRDTGRFN